MMKKHVPNCITCLSLFSGCVACVMALEGMFLYAFGWIILAALFDFLDGMFARLLKAYSLIGKELDSLSDMVSFGVAPAMMIFVALKGVTAGMPLGTYLPYMAFIIPAFSALRLAKFNLDERQSTSFIGLPTPANALFWASLITGTYGYVVGNEFIYVLITGLLILFFSYLMVAEIPMFSLKIKGFSWQENRLRYILIIGSILAVTFLGYLGIAAGIVLYIFLSIAFKNK